MPNCLPSPHYHAAQLSSCWVFFSFLFFMSWFILSSPLCDTLFGFWLGVNRVNFRNAFESRSYSEQDERQLLHPSRRLIGICQPCRLISITEEAVFSPPPDSCCQSEVARYLTPLIFKVSCFISVRGSGQPCRALALTSAEQPARNVGNSHTLFVRFALFLAIAITKLWT